MYIGPSPLTAFIFHIFCYLYLTGQNMNQTIIIANLNPYFTYTSYIIQSVLNNSESEIKDFKYFFWILIGIFLKVR